ncbi:MAG: hypothetical protein RLY40_460 [Pseudomonadota bacterium]|jgi:putative FmdB family regulatory protein
MPIYEYQCKACGHTFDTLQSFSEAPLTECPVCKEPALKKLISQAAFHLKGSGWYVTDFKNPPAKADNPDKTKIQGTDQSANKDSKNKDKDTSQSTETKSKDTTLDKTSKTEKSDK